MCPIKKILGSQPLGQTFEVCGWLRTKRSSKNCVFLIINDGSCQDSLQVVCAKEHDCYQLTQGLVTGVSLRVTGTVEQSRGEQAVELLAKTIELLGSADRYPLQKKGHTLEFLREQAHLRPRSNTFGAVFRIRHTTALASHDFFASRGFYWLATPIITANDCEGAGELFEVQQSNDFFGKPSYLTVSGQLQAEAAALALGKVYTFGPTFRAENSNTTRHLAEFWMIEPEIAFADLNDICVLAEEFVKSVTAKIIDECHAELTFLQKFYRPFSITNLEKLASCSYERITYKEAIKLLQKASVKFEFPTTWGVNLQTEHEKYLAGQLFDKPVIVTDYPKQGRPFYMRDNDDGETVAAMDLLIPQIGELLGGSQREERYDVLKKKITDNLDWYLELRKFGTVPHAGWGLGFERFVQYLTGMQNIRDVVLSPRARQLLAF